jgi:hypothetical protein
MSESAMQEKAVILKRRFEALAVDTHLPFLEVKLYRKYYIQTVSEQRLRDLSVVIDAITKHRAQTLKVLKTIHEREGVLREIKTKGDEFTAKRLATLDVQTQVLQLLHAHQQTSLRVIEAIGEWRSGLTRPYPFHWNDHNYFRKMLDDCHVLDASQLRTVLPLRLASYPLCSNITSLALFAPGGPGTNASNPRGMVAAEDKRKVHAQQARLREAEKLLFDEETLQAKVMRDLAAISAAGYFVPLLNLPAIIPSCATGIRISNKQWSRQLTDAIRDVVDANHLAADANVSDNDDEEVREIEAAKPAPSSSSASSSSSRATTPATPEGEAAQDPTPSNGVSSGPPTPAKAGTRRPGEDEAPRYTEDAAEPAAAEAGAAPKPTLDDAAADDSPLASPDASPKKEGGGYEETFERDAESP